MEKGSKNGLMALAIMEIGEIMLLKVLVNSNMLTEMFIKENFGQIEQMVKVHIHMPVVKFMLVVGKMICNMDREKKNMMMDQYLKAILFLERKKVMVPTIGLMVLPTKVIGPIIK